MTILVANCPRCDADQMTFDVRAAHLIYYQYSWQRWYEMFCVCRHCDRSTTFVLSQKEYEDGDFLKRHSPLEFNDALNNHFNIQGYISIKDIGSAPTPDYVEGPIATAFHEGAVSIAVGNWNAAGTMFRLAIDLVTRPILPTCDENGLNNKIRRDLGLRLPWLFANNLLPVDLKDLSSCVREDGNDAAHAGTLEREDALDLLDFTTALLERIVTEPKRLQVAKERRDARRTPKE